MIEKSAMAWAVARPEGPIVRKSAAGPELQALERKVHGKPRPGETVHFHVDAVAEPVSSQGKRAFIGTPMPGWSPFEIYCSEGTPLGGDDDAPSPLGYFTSAVAFCLLTHITALLGTSGLKVTGIKVEIRGNYKSAANHTGGGAESFETCAIIESDEPAESVRAFIEQCEGACIAMQTVVNATPASLRVIHNGVEI